MGSHNNFSLQAVCEKLAGDQFVGERDEGEKSEAEEDVLSFIAHNNAPGPR